MVSKSLSGDDVLKLVNHQANLVMYNELKNMQNINQLFKGKKAVILLYLNKENYGHWTGLFRKSKNLIYFFNSYGDEPDEEIEYIPEHIKEMYNEEHYYLSRLLLQSKAKIEYNHARLQQMKKGINTCGRWVATFIWLMLKNLTMDEFIDLFSNYKGNKDALVVKLTS